MVVLILQCIFRGNFLLWCYLLRVVPCPWRQLKVGFIYYFSALSLFQFCWSAWFSQFNMSWVYGEDSRSSIPLLCGPNFLTKARLLWINASKAILSDIWSERNQRIFGDKSLEWVDRFELIKIRASNLFIINIFDSYSLNDVHNNWGGFFVWV